MMSRWVKIELMERLDCLKRELFSSNAYLILRGIEFGADRQLFITKKSRQLVPQIS
jgi:hypothetical protein